MQRSLFFNSLKSCCNVKVIWPTFWDIVSATVVGVQPAKAAELSKDCQQVLDSKRQHSNHSSTSLLTFTDCPKLATTQKLLQTLAEESGSVNAR